MSPQITLFGHATAPNPPKVAILLEELGVEYSIVAKVFGDGPNGVKHPDFTKYNPNGRVPAIIDHSSNEKAVWESGAILLYLTDKFDKAGKFVGVSAEERGEVYQWLFYQVSGLGPIQGQIGWFLYFHHVKDLHPSVLERYTNETRRVYGIMDKHLAKKEWFALNRLTIADMAFYPWVNILHRSKMDISEFPNVEAWSKRMQALPSVERAYERIASASATWHIHAVSSAPNVLCLNPVDI